MRLNFNVLWVEDQQRAVQSQRERIEQLLRREGFRLDVLFTESVNNAISYLQNDIYGDHIDMVLMDYDLGTGGRGDHGIMEVRKIFPFKDIVFYSAKDTDLQNLVLENGVQGIFCSTRNDLPDTVDGVFENLVKKVIDIDHSRGIVMGATSDVDYRVIDCLTFKFQSYDETGKTTALDLFRKKISKKLKRIQEQLDKLADIKDIAELNNNQDIFTSYDRLQLLKNFLNDGASDEAHSGRLENYIQNTIPKRNILAHTKVTVNGFSRKLYNRQNEEFTNEQMKALRQELLDYQEFFDLLYNELNSSIQTGL